jgi:carboxymethylenebutenolidase
MTTQNVTIQAFSGGSFSAYLAAPSTQPRAGLVLIQEVLGVNNNMRQTADEYAKEGYLVLVPDLYWRLEPNVQPDPEDKNQWAKAFELLKVFDLDSSIKDLKASLSFLRQHQPLILHMGGNDEYVSPNAQMTIQQGLKDNPLVTIYRYEGVSHGFSRVNSSAYRKEVAELARDRTLAFLKQHLGNGSKISNEADTAR